MGKYRFTGETKRYKGRTLHRIQALRDIKDDEEEIRERFKTIKKGEKGGWIEKEDNLCQCDEGFCSGSAWVLDEAIVYGNARVYGNAKIFDKAEVFGKARIYGNARVFNNAKISGTVVVSEGAEVFDYARLIDNVGVLGGAKVFGYALFSGNSVISGGDYLTTRNRVRIIENKRLYE